MELSPDDTNFLADHAPAWLDLIRNNNILSYDYEEELGEDGKFHRKSGHSILNSASCIVGTCHGMNNSYMNPINKEYCHECKSFAGSREGLMCLLGAEVNPEDMILFKQRLTAFIKHFKAKHVKNAIKAEPQPCPVLHVKKK